MLLGGTVQQNLNEGEALYGFGYSDDIVLKNIKAATLIFRGVFFYCV